MSAMGPSWESLDLDQLSVPDRLDLITAIWDSIPAEDESLPLPEWHREELDRRLASRGEKPSIPWEEVKRACGEGHEPVDPAATRSRR